MGRLCFTVDLDRDVNCPRHGSIPAASLDRGSGDSPRFASSARGAGILMDLMDDLGMRCTFFAEARTLSETGVGRIISRHEVGFHGLDHEDFSGEHTGIHLGHDEMRDIAERGAQIVRDESGRPPRGFRAPYMSPGEDILSVVEGCGIVYDSSFYGRIRPDSGPFLDKRHGLVELPVPEGRDFRGKRITSYLWPMHEGSREPSDFIGLGMEATEGTFVICTHSWHMAETRSGGPMGAAWEEANYGRTREVLATLIDSGFRPATAEECARSILH